jgi:hypothetical protein
VALSEDLERIAVAAGTFASDGEAVEGVLATEPEPGSRVYLCAYSGGEEGHRWLALDGEGRPVADRTEIRAAASIAALCELAEEMSGGGDLEALRAELRRLAVTEAPDGIEEAEEAALALERALAVPPRLASPLYLDELGSATRRLEQALGDIGASPFAQADDGRFALGVGDAQLELVAQGASASL